jgi:hypothetical protein
MAKLPALITVGALLGTALPGTITAASARDASLSKPKAAAATDDKARICIREAAATGSILPQRICKTRAEWQADGVDLAKLTASSR